MPVIGLGDELEVKFVALRRSQHQLLVEDLEAREVFAELRQGEPVSRPTGGRAAGLLLKPSGRDIRFGRMYSSRPISLARPRCPTTEQARALQGRERRRLVKPTRSCRPSLPAWRVLSAHSPIVSLFPKGHG